MSHVRLRAKNKHPVEHKKRVMIDFGDVKSNELSKAAQELDLGEIIPQPDSPILTPIAVAKRLVRGERLDALCLRYLNDYPSLVKTVARALAEISTITLCKSFKIKLFWICHNVDRETVENHPIIMALRRRLIARSASCIFVTDVLLCQPAAQILRADQQKVRSISFGSADPPFESARSDETFKDVLAWTKERRRANPCVKIGLWVGEVSGKKARGIEEITRIVRAKENNGQKFAFVVIGPGFDQLPTRLLRSLKDSEDILAIAEEVSMPCDRWPALADFIWKPLDDLSIPLTAYNSCRAKLPLCVLPDSFLAEFVEYYEIGFAFDSTQLQHFFDRFSAWNSTACDEFLVQRTWEIGANALLKACG